MSAVRSLAMLLVVECTASAELGSVAFCLPVFVGQAIAVKTGELLAKLRSRD